MRSGPCPGSLDGHRDDWSLCLSTHRLRDGQDQCWTGIGRPPGERPGAVPKQRLARDRAPSAHCGLQGEPEEVRQRARVLAEASAPAVPRTAMLRVFRQTSRGNGCRRAIATGARLGPGCESPNKRGVRGLTDPGLAPWFRGAAMHFLPIRLLGRRLTPHGIDVAYRSG